jgi:hypothetical protein
MNRGKTGRFETAPRIVYIYGVTLRVKILQSNNELYYDKDLTVCPLKDKSQIPRAGYPGVHLKRQVRKHPGGY